MPNPHPIVRQIIDRDCHVSLSNLQVIKHVVSKLKKGRITFFSMSKKDRKQLVKDCIKVHSQNIKLYKSVMKGRF